MPLLVGGHADAALRRAVLKGDGWMHAGGDGEELDRLLARLAEIRKAEGDTRDDFEVHVISYDAYDVDGIKRLEDKGVTDCIVGFRVPYIKGPDTEPLETKIEHLEQVRRVDHQQGRAVSRGHDVTTDLTEPFREAVAEAEKLVANPPFEVSEQDLAEGYDYLAGSIRSSLQMAFDYDLEHPVLINPTHQYARQGLDNPDAVYFNAYLDAGRVVRRLAGCRGTTADLSFQVMDGTYSAEGAPGTLAAFDDRELDDRRGRQLRVAVRSRARPAEGQHADHPRGLRRLERRAARHDPDPAPRHRRAAAAAR